jgi:hypothetical protein
LNWQHAIRSSLHLLKRITFLTRPEEVKSKEMWTVTPPHIKCECSNDEEPTQKGVKRTEQAEELNEETILKLGTVAEAMKQLWKYLYDGVDDEVHTRRVVQRMEEVDDILDLATKLPNDISEETMIKIVLEDLRNNDVRTLEHAMFRLTKYLRYENDDDKLAVKQEAFFQVGGHAAVVSAMREHPNCEMLQTHCIFILLTATYSNVLIRTSVAKVKGIQAIVAAMEKFPCDKVVICDGFGALRNIVFEHESNANMLVSKLGKILFCVERMKEFQHDAEVTKNACELMWNLSHFEHLRTPIVNANAVSALVAAIDGHKDNPDIQEDAREAVMMLLMQNSD